MTFASCAPSSSLGRDDCSRACPVESDLEPQRHESFTNVLHGLRPTANRLSNLGVSPRGPLRIRLQQDLSPPHLLRRTVKFLHHFGQRRPFHIREPDDILLLHGRTLLGCGHLAKTSPSGTP